MDFAVFRVFWGISRDFAEIPEFRGSATARNIRSPVISKTNHFYIFLYYTLLDVNKLVINTLSTSVVLKLSDQCYYSHFT